MPPESFSEVPPDRRNKRHSGKSGSSGSGGSSDGDDTAEAIVDVAEIALEAANVTCDASSCLDGVSCFEAMPDCSVVDCDPGCL